MSNSKVTGTQENLCTEHPVFTPEQGRNTRLCSCGKRFFRRPSNSVKCLACREIDAHPLEVRTSAQHDHNAFLSHLTDQTLDDLVKINTRHTEITRHDKANTARLAFDTLTEDRYFRDHGVHSALYLGLAGRFRGWLHQQLGAPFHMPLVAYFMDARIVIGVQLGEATIAQRDLVFKRLGL